MNVSIGARWESFVDSVVEEGRYASASEVVREGLRLVEEREAKLKALRETIQAAIADGDGVGEDEMDRLLDAEQERLRAEGY
ncbi:type II toxin-antitoxin system ParD family antitoxin (plasmid) [Tistrella mobilis]|jgi:antitoxin ParD1/3/4|uniref:type II toxin-antitoxin system ParD family antitoxin n=1 Tax=Tistrella mobilis TaxID=171437 RepID=UPI0035571B1D